MATKKKNVVDIKDVEREIYGYRGGVMTYTPAVFDTLNVPEEKRYTVDIEPMSDEDCEAIRSINEGLQVELFLWAGQNGIDTKSMFDTSKPEGLAFLKKSKQIEPAAKKYSIIYKYLSNLQNHPDGELTEELWAATPNTIRADIYNKVYEISNVSNGEFTNLS